MLEERDRREKEGREKWGREERDELLKGLYVTRKLFISLVRLLGARHPWNNSMQDHKLQSDPSNVWA